MRLSGVSKRYGRGRPVIAGVDLDLEPREVIAITGGNGSGKSTLLRVLVGVSRPSTGSITARPRDIGYVPERFPTTERLSARSYLAHMGRLRGLSTPEAADRAAGMLDRLSLVGGADTPLRQLSKGNLQKVALAQALLVRPKLLVLDEPWSGLDSSAHGVLGEIIAETADSGGTVVFTDHGESGQLDVTRTYRVAAGRVTLADEPLTLVTRLVLIAPPDGRETPLPHALSLDHDGSRVVVRVRQEHTDELLLAALQDGWSVVRVDEGTAVAGGTT